MEAIPDGIIAPVKQGPVRQGPESPPSAQSQRFNLQPLDKVGGYEIRPGFYDINGATAIPCGVNFTVLSVGATSCELVLFRRGEKGPAAVIRFPDHYRIGQVYSMIVFGLDIYEYEYAYRFDGPYDPGRGLLFDPARMILDPYAKAVAGQSVWGRRKAGPYKARVVLDDFDWGDMASPRIPMSDLIIYELHVRGFTKHSSSGVANPGTFDGLIEKIPYLLDLGVNAVELMPVFEFDETLDAREHEGNELIDYWGYNPVCFFSPNTSYAAATEHNREGYELKRLIRALKESGIEVILDVVFNHTAEGDEDDHIFSFKGIDNNIYYMLKPDGLYHNFSGCGNTLNCNHPIVRQFILECLRYWVVNYRVDGFRFDLASILGRNEDSTPMSSPPLLHSLAFDPILSGVKLIAEAWDAGGLYQVGSFPAWSRWAEWNGRYRDDMRSFLKGDHGFTSTALQRISGSEDIYCPMERGSQASVNFITCHDGFTLNDLYSNGRKHNHVNGWDGADGTDDDRSWNCGVEGETDDPEINALRRRLMRNACAILLCSRGTPMFVAGDEFCNTQFGNNNPYCQDNLISWLDWGLVTRNADMHGFFKRMIAFRKAHPVVRKRTAPCSFGFPEVSFHGSRPWSIAYEDDCRTVGIMFAGKDDDNRDDVVFIAMNMHWEERTMELPALPKEYKWEIYTDTHKSINKVSNKLMINPRSIIILSIIE